MAHLKTSPVKSDWNPLNKNWPCDLNQVRQIFQMHWFSDEKNGWFSSNRHLVGGWTNPFEKYQSTWIISPGRDDNKTYLKPPPSHVAIFLGEVTISLSYFYPKNNLLRWDDLDTLENPPGRQLWRLNTGLPGSQRIDDVPTVNQGWTACPNWYLLIFSYYFHTSQDLEDSMMPPTSTN